MGRYLSNVTVSSVKIEGEFERTVKANIDSDNGLLTIYTKKIDGEDVEEQSVDLRLEDLRQLQNIINQHA